MEWVRNGWTNRKHSVGAALSLSFIVLTHLLSFAPHLPSTFASTANYGAERIWEN